MREPSFTTYEDDLDDEDDDFAQEPDDHYDPDAWQPGQNAYERWLDRLGGAA